MNLVYELAEGDFTKAGYASSEVKRVLKQLSVDSKLIKRIVIALYEAEVNVVAHASSGEIDVEIDSEKTKVTIADRGPGIPDIEQAMQVGYSPASEAVRAVGRGEVIGVPNGYVSADL